MTRQCTQASTRKEERAKWSRDKSYRINAEHFDSEPAFVKASQPGSFFLMARIHFYAAHDDQAAFRDYIDSMGLYVYPTRSNVLGKWSTTNGIGGYITFLAADQLHPYRAARDKLLQRSITHVSDPLIWWTPSFLTNHDGDRYIIQGCIEYDFHFSKEREEEHRKGSSYFGKLQRWIRKNWPNQKKGGIAYGPHAQRLVQYEGYLARGLPPNIKIEYVKI